MPSIYKGFNPDLGKEFMARYRGGILLMTCKPRNKAPAAPEGTEKSGAPPGPCDPAKKT